MIAGCLMDKNDYIERSAVLAIQVRIDAGRENRRFVVSVAKELLSQFAVYVSSIPAADVVPVVRCRDCKYSIGESELWCNGFCSPARLVAAEDFCSRGSARRRDADVKV